MNQGNQRIQGTLTRGCSQTLEAEVSLVVRPLGLALYFTRIHMEPEVATW